MTFYDISKKMLRADFRRYRLYFFCNLFAVSLFYCFAAIFTNQSFMNGRNVNSLISYNIYFPSVLAALFLLLFLPASAHVFFASRKQEYGILFSLGMSQKEAIRSMLLENLAVAVFALTAALISGTFLSFLFFAVIIYGIGIKGVQWEFRPESYQYTVLLYVAIMSITFVWNAGKLLHERIGALLKARYRSERKSAFECAMCRLFPGYMKKHMPEQVFVRRHKKEWGIRSLLGSLVIACAVLLESCCITLHPSLLKDAGIYSPYDLVYSEIFGMNQVPVQNVIRLLEEKGVTVEQAIEMPYGRTGNFTFLSVSDVNRIFGCDYQIEEGQFLNVFQIDPQDGYEHNLQPVSVITLDDEKLYSIGSDVRILLNQNAAFADRTLILSDVDFEKTQEDAACWSGLAHLFLFDQWGSSYEGISAVKEYLNENNQADGADPYDAQLSSKAEKYLEAKQSGKFLLFLMVFVIALMLMAEFFLIYFRIRGEQEENCRAIDSLQLIGMTDPEILKCLRYKNLLRFLPPLAAGTILSLVPSYFLNETYGAGFKGDLAGILFGIVITAGTAVWTYRYSEKELKRAEQKQNKQRQIC